VINKDFYDKFAYKQSNRLLGVLQTFCIKAIATAAFSQTAFSFFTDHSPQQLFPQPQPNQTDPKSSPKVIEVFLAASPLSLPFTELTSSSLEVMFATPVDPKSCPTLPKLSP